MRVERAEHEFDDLFDPDMSRYFDPIFVDRFTGPVEVVQFKQDVMFTRERNGLQQWGNKTRGYYIVTIDRALDLQRLRCINEISNVATYRGELAWWPECKYEFRSPMNAWDKNPFKNTDAKMIFKIPKDHPLYFCEWWDGFVNPNSLPSW